MPKVHIYILLWNAYLHFTMVSFIYTLELSPNFLEHSFRFYKSFVLTAYFYYVGLVNIAVNKGLQVCNI
jgi:hypothetical protein